MRISTRLTLSVLVPVFVALVVCAALVFSDRSMAVAHENADIVRRVRNGITELNHLLFSYISYREDRPKQQFLAEHDSLTKLIARIRLRDPEQMGLLEEIRLSTQAMKDQFLKLVSMSDLAGPAGSEELSKEVGERLVGQLLTRSRRADSSASHLRRLVDGEIPKTYRRTMALIFLLLVLTTVPLTVVLLRTRRRITASLAKLRKGTEVVRSGNLEHIINVERDDEIGELSHAFNRMTASLKEVTVSKSDLEREMVERKLAEEALRESEARLRTSLGEKEVLLKEIHHRVKNNMQVISSLVALQADELQDAAMRAVLQDVTHRVRSMALVHEKLYQSADLARVEFAEYARSLLNYLWRAHGSAASDIRLTLDLEPVWLSVNAAVPCGLILNELVSNALKHAFRDRASGEVAVWLRGGAQGRLSLRVRDNGAGLPAGFDWSQARSLGLRLVQMLAGQLHAAVEVSSARGTEFAITFGRTMT